MEAYTLVERPCRNFNILGRVQLIDPRDGREKLVLSNFAAGQTGNVIFIDTITGEGEAIELPGDGGAWGIVNWRNEKLVIGTCPKHAYLHCLDLKTRTWAEPLSDPGEKYFWDMTIGSDGLVYGGTWPGCSLLRYNPETHVLENLGRVSDNPKNQYSRPVNGGLPGTIFVAGGYDEPFLKAYDIATGQFRDFGTPGFVVKEANEQFVCIGKDEELQYYDAKTFERLPDEPFRDAWKEQTVVLPNGNPFRVFPLANGRYAGVRGQDYFIVDSLEQTPELVRIPTPAPATGIHTLVADEEGRIWGACGFGQTIFRYNPADGSYWNSSSVCDSGGEVYGMVFLDNKLYMSAYVGGDHIVYDPAAPWDQLGNANPKSLDAVRPDFVRPEGRSVLGPDGGIWTGWSAKYGTYGGALSRIDPQTHQVDVWRDPIPNEQAVAGVTADERYVYFTTNGGASGLPVKTVPCHFGVWDPERGLVHDVQFGEEEPAGNAILAIGGRVFVRFGSSLRLFDPGKMAFDGAIETGEPCGWLAAAGPSTIAAFCGEKLLLIDVETASVAKEIAIPGRVGAAVATAAGDLYFAVGEKLYRLEQPVG